MIRLKRIFPECDADTLLVEKILQRGKPAHHKGISKVAAAIEAYSNKNEYILGIVDEDKFKIIPEYITHFKKIPEASIEGSLVVSHLENTQHYLIRLCPEFEEWFWKTAESCEVNAQDYGFHDFEKFKKATKTLGVHDNPQVKKFLNAVIAKNPPAIATLRYWMEKVL